MPANKAMVPPNIKNHFLLEKNLTILKQGLGKLIIKRPLIKEIQPKIVMIERCSSNGVGVLRNDIKRKPITKAIIALK
jgi:hypothetical protein